MSQIFTLTWSLHFLLFFEGAGKILFCGNPVQALRARREKLRVGDLEEEIESFALFSRNKHIVLGNKHDKRNFVNQSSASNL